MATDRVGLAMELSFWGVVAAASAAAFIGGYQWTHQATVSVHVKQPAANQMEPLPARSVKPMESPKPGPLGAATASAPATPRAAAASPSAGPFNAFASPGSVDPTLVESPAAAAGANGIFKVQIPGFVSREAAEAQAVELQSAGMNAVVLEEPGGFALQLGAFGDRDRAETLAQQVNARGYKVTIR